MICWTLSDNYANHMLSLEYEMPLISVSQTEVGAFVSGLPPIASTYSRVVWYKTSDPFGHCKSADCVEI